MNFSFDRLTANGSIDRGDFSRLMGVATCAFSD